MRGLDRPCGFGRGDEAQGRKCHNMLTYGITLFVVRAGATGGRAFRLGNRVVHDGAVRIELLENPDDAVPGLIPDGPDGVLGASDSEGEAAGAVTDGGRGRADGARRRCYTGHGSRAPKKLADSAPRVVRALAGPLLFRSGPMPVGTVIVPKYTRAVERQNFGKTAIFPGKTASVVSRKNTCRSELISE